MPRIYSAVYLPYTYEDFVTPLQESTKYHHEVEKEYTDSMMVVDALRQRAALEPDAPWSVNLINYANQLENYAGDLMKNGLTGTTPGNLMSMHSGFGKNVTPVIEAVGREKEFQKIRDLHVGDGMLFTKMPTILEFIDNPQIEQRAYNYNKVYERAKAAAAALSDRNVIPFGPSTYNKLYYRYGKKQGFSESEIKDMRQEDPDFNKLFSDIVDEFGFMKDSGLSGNLIELLQNAIASGAMAGFKYNPEYHYGVLPSDVRNPLPSGNGVLDLINNRTPSTFLLQPTLTPKALKDNNITRNTLSNPNNGIVTGYKDNGDVQISPAYVELMYKTINDLLTWRDITEWPWKNEKLPPLLEQLIAKDRLFSNNYSSHADRVKKELEILGDTTTNWFQKQGKLAKLAWIEYSPELIPDAVRRVKSWFNELALTMGIQKGASRKTIENAISNYIKNPASYSDLADAEIRQTMISVINSSNADEVADHYTGNNRLLVELLEDGRFVAKSGERESDFINTSNYTPILHQGYRHGENDWDIITLWKKKNSNVSGPNILTTYYWNQEQGRYAAPVLERAYLDDIFMKDKITEYMQELNKLDTNMLDDLILSFIKQPSSLKIYQLLNSNNLSDEEKKNNLILAQNALINYYVFIALDQYNLFSDEARLTAVQNYLIIQDQIENMNALLVEVNDIGSRVFGQLQTSAANSVLTLPIKLNSGY